MFLPSIVNFPPSGGLKSGKRPKESTFTDTILSDDRNKLTLYGRTRKEEEGQAAELSRLNPIPRLLKDNWILYSLSIRKISLFFWSAENDPDHDRYSNQGRYGVDRQYIV